MIKLITNSKLITRIDATTLGLKRYFTGQLCPKGHCGERFVSNRRCVVCVAESKKEWANNNKEAVGKYSKEYELRNRKELRRKARLRRLRNPIKFRLAHKKDYLKHKAKRLATAKLWRTRNKTYLAEYERRKVARNPEKYSAYKRNRKARVRNANGRHTADDVISIMKLQRSRCAYCKTKLNKKYHVDHIIALVNGGSNDRSNLQILCRSCNQTKSAKDPIEFMQSQGRLL